MEEEYICVLFAPAQGDEEDDDDDDQEEDEDQDIWTETDDLVDTDNL